MPENQYITLTKENLQTEHICCAIADKKGDTCAADKKAWMAPRLANGLVFTKLDARGKVFIQYGPAEEAWAPIDAPGYLHIECFWVSGQFTGKGHGTQLLEGAIQAAKAQGKKGLTILVGAGAKKPYLADGPYMKKMGFLVADTAEAAPLVQNNKAGNGAKKAAIKVPQYELLYLPLGKEKPANKEDLPAFTPAAKKVGITDKGFVLYYSDACPHSGKYSAIAAGIAKEAGVPFTLRKLQTVAEAQAAPMPFTPYSLFYNGTLLTNEIQSPKKFSALLEQLGLVQAGDTLQHAKV